MTQFSDLELLYNQYSNLVDEIASLIEQEKFQDISDKLNYKERFIKRLASAKKTTQLSEEEKEKTKLIEASLREKEQANIDFLMKMQAEVGKELRINRNKLKVNNAYDVSKKQNHGVLIDIDE